MGERVGPSAKGQPYLAQSTQLVNPTVCLAKDRSSRGRSKNCSSAQLSQWSVPAPGAASSQWWEMVRGWLDGRADAWVNGWVDVGT